MEITIVDESNVQDGRLQMQVDAMVKNGYSAHAIMHRLGKKENISISIYQNGGRLIMRYHKREQP